MAYTVKQVLDKKKIQKILSIEPSKTILDALEQMAEHNIGALLVMEDTKLVGIFSERDYARKGILKGRKAKSTHIHELMTPNVFTVESTMSTKDCLEILNEKKFRHLPVVDSGKVMGIISVGDLVSAVLAEQKDHITYLENYIAG
jgi:CBS domain-containing protein